MKKILCVFMLLTTVMYAKINDSLSLFNESQKVEIQEAIKKIEDEKNITVYVNTYAKDDGFYVDKIQRILIINMIEEAPNKMDVELKFSKDIEIDDDAQNSLNELLNLTEETMNENKTQYILDVLDGVSTVLENVTIEEPIPVGHTIFGISRFLFLGIIVAIFGIFGMIFMFFKNKKN